MNIYLTGNGNEEVLERHRNELQALGHTVTTPMDVVAGDVSDAQNLINRLQHVLSQEVVLNTAPNDGEWMPGAAEEVKVARTAGLQVMPVLVFIRNYTNATTPA